MALLRGSFKKPAELKGMDLYTMRTPLGQYEVLEKAQGLFLVAASVSIGDEVKAVHVKPAVRLGREDKVFVGLDDEGNTVVKVARFRRVKTEPR